MNSCKYRKDIIIDRIKHELCSNEELKKINKSKEQYIPCIQGFNCGKFEENNEQNEVQK